MTDPAAGKWEAPGGHIEDGESPRQAAVREWIEETGLPFPSGSFTGEWASADGVYVGHVYEIATEADLPVLTGRDFTSNPDDPDGDRVEALAWWDPQLLVNNPAVRSELLASMPAVIEALGHPVVKVATVESELRADLDALIASARRVDAARDALIVKQAATPDVHVHVAPAAPAQVTFAPQVNVPAPNITVQAAPTPNVTIKPQVSVAAPQVDVHIPPQPQVKRVRRERDGSLTVETEKV